jgi:hypothetical protein
MLARILKGEALPGSSGMEEEDKEEGVGLALAGGGVTLRCGRGNLVRLAGRG